MNKDVLITLGVIVAILSNVYTWIKQNRDRGKAEGENQEWKKNVDSTLAGLKIRSDANMANIANDLSANHATQAAIERTQAQILQWQINTEKTLEHFREEHVEHFEHSANHDLHMSVRERDELDKWRQRQEVKLDAIHQSIQELILATNNRRIK